MATTEFYVDPSINADSGAGTIGDPYGDLEYCLEQEDWPATDTRVNIKEGTAEVVAAEIATAMADTSAPGKSVAWLPTEANHLTFQGYTAAAGDGGRGEISGGGLVSVINSSTLDWMAFVDLTCHNSGANPVMAIDDYCSVIRCLIHTGTDYGLNIGISGLVSQSYVHSVGSSTRSCILMSTSTIVEYCHCDTTALDGQWGITGGGIARRNVVVCGTRSTGGGININNNYPAADHNSIYAPVASTGEGINVPAGTRCLSLTNNLIQGFSAAGGDGIELGGVVHSYGANSVYDCETAFTETGYIVDDIGGNETLTASPFTSAATGDFSPVDTGLVKEGGRPIIIGGGLV